MTRPVLFVLAGANGAGKSSIGGEIVLRGHGLGWFNPDRFARPLMQAGMPVAEANAAAWRHGESLLLAAIRDGSNHAFETTLGGKTMPRLILQASQKHDVLMWFCGLSSPEQHVARVQGRVAAGGHDIPEAKIRERCVTALTHLIDLMPQLAQLRVYDNSIDARPGEPIPDPQPVAEMAQGRLLWPAPDDAQALAQTPHWAKPLLLAAMLLGR